MSGLNWGWDLFIGKDDVPRGRSLEERTPSSGDRSGIGAMPFGGGYERAEPTAGTPGTPGGRSAPRRTWDARSLLLPTVSSGASAFVAVPLPNNCLRENVRKT
jgi:hypothetical protein